MDCKKKFGEMMRQARESRGMTLEELASLIGATSIYCRDVEHGKYPITWVMWLKICTVLGIDMNSAAEIVMASVRFFAVFRLVGMGIYEHCKIKSYRGYDCYHPQSYQRGGLPEMA